MSVAFTLPLPLTLTLMLTLTLTLSLTLLAQVDAGVPASGANFSSDERDAPPPAVHVAVTAGDVVVDAAAGGRSANDIAPTLAALATLDECVRDPIGDVVATLVVRSDGSVASATVDNPASAQGLDIVAREFSVERECMAARLRKAKLVAHSAREQRVAVTLHVVEGRRAVVIGVGTLTRDQIMAVVRAHATSARGCYEAAVAKVQAQAQAQSSAGAASSGTARAKADKALAKAPSAPPSTSDAPDTPSTSAPIDVDAPDTPSTSAPIDVDPDPLEGRIVVRFTIGAKGNVVEAATHGDVPAPLKDVAACVLRDVKKWRFPAPLGGGVVK